MDKVTVYHIDTGETQMYPVDAQSAVGGHPDEWSALPWTDETRAKVRSDQAPAASSPDAKRQQEIVRLQAQADAAAEDSRRADAALESAKGVGDQKKITKAQGDADAAKELADEAKTKLDKAKAAATP